MISLAAVTKSYAGVEVLAPTSLAIGASERLAIVGPSGSGKSTLLKTIIGVITPDAGTVSIGGTVLSEATASALRLRMGYVIQEGGLFPHLTNRDNVALLARRRGWDAARIDAKVAELAELVRLDAALLARYPLETSGGERQRVGIMRALMLDPDVLLLDEPMGALDAMARAMLQEELAEIVRARRKCMALVTHDLAEAAKLADRIAVMKKGRILQTGTLDELVAAPVDAFVAEFLRAQRSLGAVA